MGRTRLRRLLVALGLVAAASTLAGCGPSSMVRSFGDLVTTGACLAVLARILQMFPSAFRASSFAGLFVRLMLALSIVGTAVGVAVQSVILLRRFRRWGGRWARLGH